MKKLIWISGALLLPSLALLAQGPRGGGGFPMAGRGMGMMAGPRGLVTGAPYSATQTETNQETLADGNTITRTHTVNVYRDSQGRVRTEETITPNAATGKQPYSLVTILDYVGGHRYLLDSSTMTAYESALRVPRTPPSAGNGPSPMARRGGAQADVARPDRPNVVHTALTPQSINGVLSTGSQRVETIPAGAIGNARPIQATHIVWMSNELKVPVQMKSIDPRFGSSDMELTNIVQAEPSASLFVVPAGYSVKTGGRGFGGPGGPRGPRPGPPPQQ
ncbi:MAG: hypothetical protein KGN84_16510 [Acidobacteriota bacterium]|nr:hypothetical protein [Acidobacteriota bacterium]